MSPENKIAKSIVDSAYKIHTATGPGLLESVYERILSYELRKKGHDVLEEHLFFNPREHFGGGQFIYSDQKGTLIGGSDPRRDGIAIGY